MSTIIRFSAYAALNDDDDPYPVMDLNPEGDWVHFEDVTELQAEVEKLRADALGANARELVLAQQRNDWADRAHSAERRLAHAQSCAVSMEAVCAIASEISLLNESEEADGEDDYTIQFELMPKLQTALRDWRLKRNAQSHPAPLGGVQQPDGTVLGVGKPPTRLHGKGCICGDFARNDCPAAKTGDGTT